MNCDQVFDILTRGPFPAGEPSDEAVEWHLEGCDECGRLAEALRPAVELLHEAIVEHETEALPGYSGRSAYAEMPWNNTGDGDTSNGDTDRSKAGRLAVKPRPTLRRAVPSGGKVRRLWQLIASVALGMMLAWGLSAMDVSDGKNTPSGAQGYLTPDSRGLTQLVTLNLPRVCFEARSDAVDIMDPEVIATAPTARRDFRCCARCHADGRVELDSIKTTSKVVQSCQVCHSS